MSRKEQATLMKFIRELPRYDYDQWGEMGPSSEGSWVDISMVLEFVRNLKVTTK